MLSLVGAEQVEVLRIRESQSDCDLIAGVPSAGAAVYLAGDVPYGANSHVEIVDSVILEISEIIRNLTYVIWCYVEAWVVGAGVFQYSGE